MKRIPVLLLLALLMPCAIAGVRPLSLGDLCTKSSRIVRGVVTAQQSRWEGTKIVTDWTVEPLENLKGTGTAAIRVKVPGGTIGALTMHASESPRFAVGEEVVLFLRAGVSPCDVYGWFRGKYTVVDGKVREKQGTTREQFVQSIVATLNSREKGR